MKKRFKLAEKERRLFRQTMVGTKLLQQDTVKPSRPFRRTTTMLTILLRQKQLDANFYFPDEFQPLLQKQGPTRYIRPGTRSDEMKKLQRGDYTPELFLDLHGLTQTEAKQELGAFIAACRREQVYCASVMHGHGKHILKQQIPWWLAHHPDVIGFHQAPKNFGGNAALLILVDLSE
ncbi:MAG: putative endonuclease SmrB [Sodalis sp. Fle]|nr:MAG: putative endonuclease SmrB [Sodalis sp. Fle]